MPHVLNISQNTIKSIFRKLKEYRTTTKLPRSGYPLKLPVKEIINQRSSQETHDISGEDPQLRWENLSTGQLLFTSSSNLAFMQEESYCWKKVIWSSVLSLTQRQQTCERKCFGQMSPKLNIWASMQNAACVRNLTLHINLGDTITTGKHSSDRIILRDAFLQQGLESCSEWIGKWMKPNTA